ncbi:MAG: class I SAM-dependent methyltransferase [Enterobacteriaceae bacterium]
MTDTDCRMNRVAAHFEQEAAQFDDIILRLVPRYREMIEVLVTVIPFTTEDKLSIIDLGCGTGSVARAVQEKFPHAQITCVDISPKMLEMATQKIGAEHQFIHCDFDNFTFPDRYDLVISSLALHHLETESDKGVFYKKIFDALRPGGMFINIDIVLAGDAQLQDVYMEKWIAFMREAVSEREITEQWLPTYENEDRPTSIMTHTDLLRQAGFSCLDIVYKYYNFAVYCAKK